MSEEDRDTPVEVWRMHPALPKVGSEMPQTDANLGLLEQILQTMQENLAESRDIKISAKRSCDLAIQAFDKLPKLEKRMRRLEWIMLAVVVINAAITWLH